MDEWDALRKQIQEAELWTLDYPKRIRVSALALAGTIFFATIYDEDGNDTGEKEILMHHDDWGKVQEEAKRTFGGYGSRAYVFGITDMWGIPVIVEQ